MRPINVAIVAGSLYQAGFRCLADVFWRRHKENTAEGHASRMAVAMLRATLSTYVYVDLSHQKKNNGPDLAKTAAFQAHIAHDDLPSATGLLITTQRRGISAENVITEILDKIECCARPPSSLDPKGLMTRSAAKTR